MPPKATKPKPAAKAKPKPKPTTKKKPEAAKPKRSSPRKITGDHELGEHYGVTKKSIYNWREEGMPGATQLPSNQWEYDLDQTDPWVEIKKEKTAKSDALAAIHLEQEQHDLRITRARADSAERKNQLEEGNVLERDTWELFAAEAIQEMRDGILRVPTFFHSHLCKRCQGKKQELREQLEDVLIRFANKIREGPSTDD